MKLLLIIALLFSFNVFGASFGNQTTMTVTQGGGLIKLANKNRKEIILQNVNGAGTVTVKLDSVPANIDDGMVMDTHDIIKLDLTNAVWGMSSNPAGDIITIIEIIE